MKNNPKNLSGGMRSISIIAFAAVIALMAACDNSSDGDYTPGHFGDSMTLTGRVYLNDWANDPYVFTPFTGSGTLGGFAGGSSSAPSIGGSGSITNGNLSFTIGTPPTAHLRNINELGVLQGLNAPVISNANARFLELELKTNANPDSSTSFGNIRSLFRWNLEAPTISGNVRTIRDGWVDFIFVDRDVTISASDTSDSGSHGGVDWTGMINAFSITLRAGWNAVHFEVVWVATSTGASFNSANVTNEAWTETVSTGNPASMRWVMSSWTPYSPFIQSGPMPFGTVGTPYSEFISYWSELPVTFAVTSGSLPGGLTLNTSTGEISGTPTVDSTFNFEITATNAAGSTSASVFIEIFP